MILSRKEMLEELKKRALKIKSKIEENAGELARQMNFSMVDLFTLLFYHELRHDPRDPGWIGRDRLIVSNLSAIPSLLAILCEFTYMDWKEFKDLVTKLPKIFANPNLAIINYPGVELITESPYTGMVMANGHALASRKSRQEYRVYHITTDKRTARLQDVLLSGSHFKLNNITSIVPHIELQKRASTVHFWFSMGWQIEEVRVEEMPSLYDGFHRLANSREKPQVILG